MSSTILGVVDMTRLREKRIGSQLVIRTKLSEGDTIASKDYRTLARGGLRCFMTPKSAENRKLEFFGTVGIRLSKRLKKPMSAFELYYIVVQIAEAVMKIRDNGLSPNKIILNTDNIYINETTKEIQLIYMPLTAERASSDVLGFIMNIIYIVRLSPQSDRAYVSDFYYFLRSLPQFDAVEIERYVDRFDVRIMQLIRKDNAKDSTRSGPTRKEWFIGSEDEQTGLLVEEVKTSLLDDENETGLLVEDDMAGNRSPIQATLVQISTGESININKTVFTIGKDRSRSDFSVAANNAVSRIHAEIICRNERFFIVDLHSKNGTYINDKILPAHYEVEIHNGDTLKLANEAFAFHT